MSFYFGGVELTYEVQFAQEVSELFLIIGEKKETLVWDENSNSFKGKLFVITTGGLFYKVQFQLEGNNSKKNDFIKGTILIKKENDVILSQNISKYLYENNFTFDFGEIIVTAFDLELSEDFDSPTEGGSFDTDYDGMIDNLGGGTKMGGGGTTPSKSYKIKKEFGENITVFYGTNRTKTGNSEPNKYYGDELGKLVYGSCIINIPKDHIRGNIERPSKILWIWSLRENENDHIVLKKIEEKTEIEFYQWLKNSLPQTENKSGLLFVHGYNNSFAEAAWRTGQIAYDTPFNGLTGLFSWPSAGKTLDYLADGEKAIASVLKLEKFIEDFIIKTGVKKLHIIAHSMGNIVVTNALKNLAQKASFRSYIKVIDQIILAAPDIDQDVFKETLLPTLNNIGTKRTLYASDKDQALSLSESIRSERPRLGQGGEDIFVANGIDSIDASNVMSEGNHHSYIFETKELLMDMNILFEDGWEPIKRRLVDKEKNGLKYWLFRI